jgi:hypothetical protein
MGLSALGCYGAFGMTNYYEALDKEGQQGINIIEAAKSAKLKHLVLRYVCELLIDVTEKT